MIKRIAATVAAVWLMVAVEAQSPSQNIPISRMPTASSALGTAYLPIIQPYPGRTTNDNFKVTVDGLFLNRSLSIITNLYVTNLYVQNIIGGASDSLWTNFGPYISPLAFTNAYFITTNGTALAGRSVWPWFSPGTNDVFAGVHDQAQGESPILTLQAAAVDDAASVTNYAYSLTYLDSSPGGQAYFTVKQVTNGLTSGFIASIHPGASDVTLTLLNKGVFSFRVADNSGYDNSGAHFLSDDGTYKTVPGLLTINPTDSYIPYRQDATTFDDSPLYRIDAATVGVDTIAAGTVMVTNLQSGGVVYTGADGVLTNVVNGTGFLYNDGSNTNLSWIDLTGGLWTNLAGVLQPVNLTLPVGVTNTLIVGNSLDATNYSRLAIYSTGTNTSTGGLVFDSQSGGTAGTPRPFVFTNASVVIRTNGTKTAPALSFGPLSGGRGLFVGASGSVDTSISGLNIFRVGNDSIRVNGYIGFTPGDPEIVVPGAKMANSTGSPEGVVYGNPGSIYLRSDGVSGSTLYTKISTGLTNTGWEAIGSGVGGSSRWTNIAGVLQPIDLTAPVGWTNQVILGPGTTNVLYRDGTDLVYTNGATSPVLLLHNGSGSTVSFGFGSSGTIAQMSGVSGVALGWSAGLLDLGGAVGGTNIAGSVPFNLGTVGKPFWNVESEGVTRIYGYNALNDIDYARLSISHTGTNASDRILFNSISAGTAGTVGRPFAFTNAPIVLPSFTKAQKATLTTQEGMILFQSDNTPGVRVYQSGAWVMVSTVADP